MNLPYSIKEICTILNAPIPEGLLDADIPIKNLVIDSRSPRISQSTLFVALTGNKQDGHNFLDKFELAGGKIALVSKINSASKVYQICVEDTLSALQKLAKFHRAKYSYPVIGITGSNGKTIVKEWIYHLLKDKYSIVRSPKSFNSQIGVALSLLEMDDENDLAIIEAGIGGPGDMDSIAEMIQPSLGVFTGIGDAHSANFDSIEQKKEEKYKLFKNVQELIEPLENDNLEGPIPFKDAASISNAQLASKVALKFDLSEDQLIKKLADLPVVSMRLEQVKGINNCTLINDAYTADFSALEIALRYLTELASGQKKILVLNFSDEQIEQLNPHAISDLVYTASLNEIAFIGSQNILAKARIAGNYFKTVDEFLSDPPVYKDAIILFKGSRYNSLEKIVRHYAEKKHITQLEVSLSAMRKNLNVFRSKLKPRVKTLAMVKAQSYGTGLVDSSLFLQAEGVHYLGVAYADEGVALRNAGVKTAVIVMNPEATAFDEIIDYQLEPSIYSTELLQSFLHHLILRKKTHFPIHLKLDTGMNRLGFGSDQLKELLNTLKTQPEVFVKSVFSHLSASEDPNEQEFTNGQIQLFKDLTEQLNVELGYEFDRHIANSSAVLNYPDAHFEMVRLGIGLYGLIDNQQDLFEDVLCFKTQISQIKIIESGDSVGYGRNFIANEKTKIGIIPVGYADGLSRGLSAGKWEVMVNNVPAKILGTVCMDMCIIDLTEINAEVGDDVQIFGPGNTIFEMATILNTIPYEIISSISNRVHRVYLD